MLDVDLSYRCPYAATHRHCRFNARKQLLAIAILSVRQSVHLFVCHTGGSVKNGEARITKSSPSAARKTPVLGTVKLFHKFEGGHPERGR